MTANARPARWSLTLYVSGAAPCSAAAIENIRRICDDELGGDVDLEIVDIRDAPAVVLRDEVVVVPTLVRRLPAPLRRLVGDLSDTDHVRRGLEIPSIPATGG